jgi:hypothetical protein
VLDRRLTVPHGAAMTLTEHLTTATTAITATTNPDGHDAVGALLLATHTGTRIAAAVADNDSAAWDFCALSLADATAELRTGIAGDLVLSPAISAATVDDWELTARVTGLLISRLNALYADAATGERGSPSRRRQWQRVAEHLVDAAADVP